MPTYTFPVVLMTINVMAALHYLIQDGDWNRFFYWLFACGLTLCVTIR